MPPDPNDATQCARRVERSHLARLRALAERLDHQAMLLRNGGYNTQAEAQAGHLSTDAFALRWALRRLAPGLEGPGQLLAALHRAAPGGRPAGR